ncbi:MAG: RND family transporter [Thermodesulfobacteria bacterium]|nr:RND family transporter [Thermodesulfobacteriota bacterium]
MSFYEKFVLRHKGLWLLIIVVFVLLSAWQAMRLPIVTSTDAIIPRDEEYRFYERFREEFGADDAVAVALKAEDVFTPAVLSYIKRLTENFEEIEEVEDVLSLTNVEDVRGGKEIFVVEPLVGDEIPRDPERLSYLKDRAAKNPLILGNLVSPDFRSTMLLIRTAYKGEDLDFESRLIAKVRKILDQNPPPPGVEIHLSGWPVVNVNMASYMNRDLMVFVPTSFCFLCLLVLIFLRSVRAMAAVGIIINLSLLAAMACLKLVGGALSPMTAILAPLTMALALADAIHLLTSYFKHHQQGNPRAVAAAVAESWSPCFLTSLTTAVGFASLMISRIPSIREFGAAAACAMFVEYFFTFTVLAFLLPWIGRGKHSSRLSKTLLSPLIRTYPRWARGSLLVFLLLTLLSLWGLKKIRVDSDVIEFFHHKTPVYQDAIFIDKHLGGVQTIEISLKVEEGDFINPKLLAKVDALSRFLEGRPLFSKVVSAAEFFKLMNRAFHNEDPRFYRVPESRELLAQYLLLYGGTELEHFLDTSQTWTRVSARTPEHSSEAINREIALIEKKLEEIFKDTPVKYRLTGKTYLVNRTVEDIVKSQTESLALAAVIIFGLMFLVLRSIKIGLLSIPPNIFPIIANLGFMGFVGIPLNTATATISAVAIGIAVDDTIHFLVQYQRERRRFEPITAVKRTLESKGLAAITTSVVLIVGFLVLVVSKFIPTAQFGKLCALVMGLALAADLLLLPALIYRGRKIF